MYRIAEDILKDTQIPFEALLPLIDQTAAKLHHMKPVDAQTGPAKRNDQAVINHHLEVLSEYRSVPSVFSAEEKRALYQELAALIAKAQNH